MAICFANVPWSEPGATPGTYVLRNRNVMSLTGLSPAMAKMLDNHFDGRVDARFGKFREQAVANNTAAASIAWTQNESNLDEADAQSELDLPEGSYAIASPVTGTVWKILVEVGQSVKLGDPIIIVESMKMEIAVDATASGPVHSILCQKNESISAGQLLVVIQEN